MGTAKELHDDLESMNPAEFGFTRRTWVDATPDEVYRLVSDVSAISRWSPNASDVAFDEGAGPVAGAWFSGRNTRNGKEWTTRSQVTKAEPGAEFAFVVGGAREGIVEWTWTFEAHDNGTLAAQSWRLLRLDPVLGRTRADVEELRDYMAASAESTLSSLAEWITATRSK
ncbi:SRPBCC family protein [Lentzea sp. NPDC058450]|uniref:SRPBCC family protein n=1 Tax=Lentzea sp. NPDC058450 TaxID=3346505 RepID=UPI00365A7FEA